MTLTANKLFNINISEDKLVATLSLHASDPPDEATSQEILNQIDGIKIIYDDEGKKYIEKFAAQLARKEIPEPILISRGQQPVSDQPGEVEILFANSLKSEDQSDGSQEPLRQSHYDRSTLVTVKEDQALLRLIPLKPGKNGGNERQS